MTEQNVLSYYIVHSMGFSLAELSLMFMLQKSLYHLYLSLNYVHTHIFY
jgi:hypothetical protein